ncbi:MAG: S8 family serine peptidase [Candidatus Sericytochromatia bacterium]|nr:S8 family serine peptidase [Candidatus Sericytochromatia bacterium]
MKRQTKLISMAILGAIASACAVTPTIAPSGLPNTQQQSAATRGRKMGDPALFDSNGNSKAEMMVEVKSKAELSALKAQGAKLGFTVTRTWPQINAAAIKLDEVTRGDTVTRSLRSVPGVISVQAAQQAILETEPNDPEYAKQYGMKLMNVANAWNIQPGKASIKIALVDTGVDLSHPDLKDKIVASYNSVTPGQSAQDGDEHGTHCAGIAAGIANNGLGVVGVAAGCSIIPVKALGNGGSEASITDGVIWAADHGANVITMSLGLYKRSPVFEKALGYALGKGVTITASAGNNNAQNDPDTAPHLPSTYPGVIEVAATDAADQKASFSNFGKTVSVAAPGVNILSCKPGGGYQLMSGTSMAAPHAAGLAALILSNHPDWKPAQVKAAMQASAKDLGTSGFDPIFGFGRIDALSAVQK